MVKENKLRAKIVENNYTINDVSSMLNIDITTFYRKIKNSSFTVTQVDSLSHILRLNNKEISDIFFG